jgi:hypothetical protein
MKYRSLAGWSFCAFFMAALSGCGAGDSTATDEAPTAAEAEALGCFGCQRFSSGSLNGVCCTCAARGISSGVLHNDEPSTPNTYYCRAH